MVGQSLETMSRSRRLKGQCMCVAASETHAVLRMILMAVFRSTTVYHTDSGRPSFSATRRWNSLTASIGKFRSKAEHSVWSTLTYVRPICQRTTLRDLADGSPRMSQNSPKPIKNGRRVGLQQIPDPSYRVSRSPQLFSCSDFPSFCQCKISMLVSRLSLTDALVHS
jgi:hypothetical protein